MLDDLGLSEHCKEVTHPAFQKILALMLTNKPDAVTEVKSLPGMSDPNIICANFKLATTRSKLHHHKIFKYNKADQNKVRDATKIFVTNYFGTVPDNLTVEENGAFIESGLQDIIDKEIPSKLSRSKETYP